MSLPAVVFLDRDGTIIRDTSFISNADHVELLPGAAGAIRALNELRIPVVVATNQSGIGRGYYSESDYENVRERMESLLADAGARIDRTYHCPHAPDSAAACDCRKPAPGMFVRALEDLRIAGHEAVLIGDSLRDVTPALALGARGILLASGDATSREVAEAELEFDTAPTLAAAVDMVIAA